MKRIFAITGAVLALASVGAGSALAGGSGNFAGQSANIGQLSAANAKSLNFGGGALVSVNVSKASSGNGAAIWQQLSQLNF